MRSTSSILSDPLLAAENDLEPDDLEPNDLEPEAAELDESVDGNHEEVPQTRCRSSQAVKPRARSEDEAHGEAPGEQDLGTPEIDPANK